MFSSLIRSTVKQNKFDTVHKILRTSQFNKETLKMVLRLKKVNRLSGGELKEEEEEKN